MLNSCQSYRDTSNSASDKKCLENKILLFLLLHLKQPKKSSPRPDTTQLAWAFATCKEMAHISLCEIFVKLMFEKWNSSSNCGFAVLSLGNSFAGNCLPMPGLLRLYSDRWNNKIVCAHSKLSSHWSISCASFRARQLKEAGGQIQWCSTHRQFWGMTRISGAPSPGNAIPHTFPCMWEISSFFSLLSQHSLPPP